MPVIKCLVHKESVSLRERNEERLRFKYPQTSSFLRAACARFVVSNQKICRFKSKEWIVKYFYLLVLFFIAGPCNGQLSEASAEKMLSVPVFKTPAVADTLAGPQQAESYVALHYWDHFDFTDTGYIHFPEASEQIVVDYLHILQGVPSSTAVVSLRNMMEKAAVEKRMFAYFAGLYEKYLYEPSSPFCNEEWLLPVLEVVTHSSVPDEVDKIRPAYLLEQIRKNRTGEPATDFAYTLADGQTGTLYGVDSDCLLLFFYQPDCHTCQETMEEMAASEVLREKIAEGQLTVLAVYPEADREVWRNHLQDIPPSWMNAYDESGRLQEEELYDFKVFPTLYLLDKAKEVILKAPDLQQTLDFLHQK